LIPRRDSGGKFAKKMREKRGVGKGRGLSQPRKKTPIIDFIKRGERGEGKSSSNWWVGGKGGTGGKKSPWLGEESFI